MYQNCKTDRSIVYCIKPRIWYCVPERLVMCRTRKAPGMSKGNKAFIGFDADMDVSGMEVNQAAVTEK